DESIVCEVSNWRVEDAPAYIAVSYVWGDPKEVSTITINSRPATVRTNYEYVLQQQAPASATVGYYLWVDAICIDQQNTTKRSHQVALMGRIYSKATRVHACTG
ncbi:HET-domain-containing protein, partial [Phaeosphaeriaceae sp. SRC1lsM3a]